MSQQNTMILSLLLCNLLVGISWSLLVQPSEETTDDVDRRLKVLEQENILLRQELANYNALAMQCSNNYQKLNTDFQATKDKFNKDIAALQRKDKSVAFFAYLENDMVNPADNTTVIFSDVVTNVGSNYDPIHGVFRAPVNGTYFFTLVASTPSKNTGHSLWLFITENGKERTYMFLDANGHEAAWIQKSTSALLHLTENDRVWVLINGHSGSPTLAGEHYRYNTYHTHFSGFLISAD